MFKTLGKRKEKSEKKVTEKLRKEVQERKVRERVKTLRENVKRKRTRGKREMGKTAGSRTLLGRESAANLCCGQNTPEGIALPVKLDITYSTLYPQYSVPTALCTHSIEFPAKHGLSGVVQNSCRGVGTWLSF